jgi:hypothetical protein
MALTKSDKDFIGSLLNVKKLSDVTRVVLEELIEEKGLVTKEDLKYLPTKDEFYGETLKILKGIEDLKSEKDILSHQVSKHSDRIEDLEKIHPQGKHLAIV